MKSRVKKRVIALMLCMVMVLSSGISTLAEGDAGTPEATEEVSSTNDESAVNTEPDTAVAEESQSRSNTAVETETAAEENAPAEAEAQPKTAEAAPAENTEADAAAQTPVEETQTEETKDNAADAQSTEQSAENGEAVQEETTTPETENETAQNTETAPQPYEGKYEDDTIKITVNAEAGIVPEGAELSVTPIEKTEITDDMTAEEKAEAEKINDQYDLTEKKLNEDSKENEETMEGFLAYDISFLVNGGEVEPSGDVNVVMEFKEAAIPEGVSEDADVTVKHLKEDETAEDGVVVEDMADKAEVQTTEKAEVEKVELTSDSFSTFTITWVYDFLGENEWIQINVHYVDENGTPIDGINQDNLKNLKDGKIVNLNDYRKIRELVDKGYKYLRTVQGELNGKPVERLKCEEINETLNTTYKILTSEQNAGTEFDEWLSVDFWDSSKPVIGNIYFIYSRINEQTGNEDIKIVDDIMESGCLKLELTGDIAEQVAEADNVKYVWYKSVNGNEFEEVTPKRSGTQDNYGVGEDGKAWLHVAVDEGALGTTESGVKQESVRYRVSVIIDDAEKGQSNPFSIYYWNELQNGSFEIPVNPDRNKSMEQYDLEDYISKGGVWKTTGLGEINDKDGQDIEILATNTPAQREGLKSSYHWQDNQEPAAADGDQFAELNCEAAGALYQDVLTIEGQTLNYWFSHRARGDDSSEPEADTMYVVIMPTKEALFGGDNQSEVDTQQELQKYLNMTSEEREALGVYVKSYTDNDQRWYYHEEIRKYTAKTSLTRFFFVAGPTAVSETVGNFLDEVGFSQQLPEPEYNEFSIQIEKQFKDLDDTKFNQVKNQLKFKVSAVDNATNIPLTDEEVNELFGTSVISYDPEKTSETVAGNLIWYLSDLKIDPERSYTITLEEMDADLAGYNCETESTARVEPGDGSSDLVKGESRKISFTVAGKTTAQVTFTNTYERSETKNVTFTKKWDDDGNRYSTRPDSLTVTLKGTINVEEGGAIVAKELTADELGLATLDQTLTAANAVTDDPDTWRYSWEDVPVYYDYNGIPIKINYSVEEGEINSNYVYEAGTVMEGDGSDYQTKDFPELMPPTQSGTNVATDNQNLVANSISLQSAKANGNSDSELGAPLHNKYIEYNEATGEYTLNLDVTGAKGEAKGADILFVIDTSGSMADPASWEGWYSQSYLAGVKELLTKPNGIIDQIFAKDGNVNSVAYVSFAGKGETKNSGWYSDGSDIDINGLKSSINRLRATGGTNWTYAMQRASSVLAQRSSSDNEKVVIFLSDGAPTYTINDRGNQSGYGNYTIGQYYEDAIDEVAGSSSLKNAQFYSVYLTSGTKDGMQTFSDGLKQEGVKSELKDGTNLPDALEEILNQIIPSYTNVSITDKLSQYVEFAEANPTITVKVEYADGSTESLVENEDYTKTIDGNTVTVDLLKGGELSDGATYTVSFKVKPTQKAEEEYSEKGYGDTQGDAGTGITSAGKAGFYSNDAGGTKLTYTVGEGESKNVPYPMPVVQVTTHTLTYEKIWERPANVDEPTDDVKLVIGYTDGTTGEITLSSNDNYKYEETGVPVTKKIASVIEVNGNPDYTPSYQISEDGTKVTITNSYSKITTQTIKVQKVYANVAGDEKPEVQVALYQSRNGENAVQYGEIITLSDSNEWTHEWTGLLTSEGEGESLISYSYAVREVNIPPHYTSSINYIYDDKVTTATITNTYDPNCADENFYVANVLQTDEISANKTWEDDNDVLDARPENLDITVNNGQGGTYTLTLNDTNGWSESINVPRVKDADYTATENFDDSRYEESSTVYETSNSASFYFVNTLKSTSITVSKSWNDRDITDRPTSISFVLEYAPTGTDDWTVYGGNDNVYTLTAEDYGEANQSWTKIIDNLPAGYDYRVRETAVTDSEGQKVTTYSSEITSTQDEKAFTITNTLTWSAVKTDNPENGEDGKNLQGATFELRQGEGDDKPVVATGTSAADGVITWVPAKGVDLNALNGTYTIKETKAPDGYTVNQSVWTVIFTEGLLTQFNGVDEKGNADDGVVIKLENDKLYELPETGGTGIYWYMLGGVLLMMAGSLLVYKKRRGEVLRRK